MAIRSPEGEAGRNVEPRWLVEEAFLLVEAGGASLPPQLPFRSAFKIVKRALNSNRPTQRLNSCRGFDHIQDKNCRMKYYNNSFLNLVFIVYFDFWSGILYIYEVYVDISMCKIRATISLPSSVFLHVFFGGF